MRIGAVLAAAALIAFTAKPVPAAGEATDTSTDASQQQQQDQPPLSEGELDQLVAPIALYPDDLLAQVIMASTYPLEVVQADRFAKANKSLSGDKLDDALAKQDWDPSVKALVATPTVLGMMSDELDWTQNLGDAVLAQQADVMDAIQRLRSKAEANGKLATTKEQKVIKTEEAGKQVIVIEPATPETVYVPYYDPAVVYGSWSYPSYPPYYFPPAPGYVVGGALARGIAWGAGFAIGNAIWDSFDWGHNNIRVDIDKNININKRVNRNDVKTGNWQHNSYHRRGVNYRDTSVRNKYAKADARAGDRKLDYRGHSGQQVLKPDKGKGPGAGGRDRPGDRPGSADLRPGGGDGKRPDMGKGPGGDGKRPDTGKARDRAPAKQANLDRKTPDLAKPAQKARPKPNAFDASDGAKAKDFSKRGQASLGNRGSKDFAAPPRPKVSKGGGPQFGGKGGGGRQFSGGGGGGRAMGGRGGGRGGGGGGRGGGRR